MLRCVRRGRVALITSDYMDSWHLTRENERRALWNMAESEVCSGRDCSWPKRTQRLRVTKEAGLVSLQHHGRKRVYRLDSV